MLGLGEKIEEIHDTIDDLVSVGLDVLTIGQYLQPSKKHLPVQKFIEPKVFQELKNFAIEKGINYVESGPLVRSSYKAEKHI